MIDFSAAESLRLEGNADRRGRDCEFGCERTEYVVPDKVILNRWTLALILVIFIVRFPQMHDMGAMM